MANTETITDGVNVYVTSLPQTAQDIVRDVISTHPNMTDEEAMTEALHRLTDLADFAVGHLRPEPIIA